MGRGGARPSRQEAQLQDAASRQSLLPSVSPSASTQAHRVPLVLENKGVFHLGGLLAAQAPGALVAVGEAVPLGGHVLRGGVGEMSAR